MDRPVTTSAAERAALRGSLPVRRFRRGEEPGDDLSTSTTPEERLAMMGPLTEEAWALTGLPVPDYPRERTPVRLVRRSLPSRAPEGR